MKSNAERIRAIREQCIQVHVASDRFKHADALYVAGLLDGLKMCLPPSQWAHVASNKRWRSLTRHQISHVEEILAAILKTRKRSKPLVTITFPRHTGAAE